MNRKQFARLYRRDSRSPGKAVYIGGYRKRRGGVPEWAYRAVCFLLLSAAAAALYATDALLQGMHTRLLYAAAWLTLAYCLRAVLLLPGTQSVREDTYYNSIGKLRISTLAGILITAALLAMAAVPELLAAMAAFAALALLAWIPRYEHAAE